MALQHSTGTFRSSGSHQLFNQHWLPGSPKALVVLSHGYAEHSSRYAAFAEVLVAEGFAVYALDHKGHGKSEGERANIGVFREYVEDLKRYIESLREQHPELPRFLFGHSMGGAIACQLVIEHPHKVDGLILSAPYLKNAVQVSPILLSLTGALSRVVPSLPTIRVDTEALARDKAVVEAYKADPLVYTGGTKARMGHELVSAGPYILSRASSIHLPLLIMHGTADAIADVAGSQALYEAAGSEDKRLELFEGSYHEILNDLDKEKVYGVVLNWLKGQLTSS